MKQQLILTISIATCLCAGLIRAEHDYYRTLKYPNKRRPDVALDRVEQEGGPDAVGYRRRTVHWWPRKGQDIVDIPEGVPLRTWTRNKGQDDPEALIGVARNWTTSDGDTFKAHLIGFRGFGIETPDPRFNYVLAPAAILRMENGERRGVLVYPPFSMMLSKEDHEFIYRIWQKEWKKIMATQSPEEYVHNPYRVRPNSLVLETEHFTFTSDASTEHKTLWWMRPHEPEKQDAYRKGSLEFAENMWMHIEASGSALPMWRREGTWKKYNILVALRVDGGYAGGGFNACDLRDCTGGPRNIGLTHEWYHGHAGGGWSAGYFGEILCHTGRHFNMPGELLMFSSNFCYPWRNVNCTQYQSGMVYIGLGDNPNWGYGISSVGASLAAAVEPTPFHTFARLGQERGIWKNGIKGFCDYFGEYAARMATCDFVMQYAYRSKYGMPEMTCLQPVYGDPARWRVPNSEAPRMYGFNLVRLVPDEDTKEITVDFQGFNEPTTYSDWRACIVAVDGEGRARYSPLWNKDKMNFRIKPADRHFFLTVAATPLAMPISDAPRGNENCRIWMAGVHAPRYPWEVVLDGCKPGSPHRRQGDVLNFDELYAMNNGNKYMGYAVKQEVPIPLTDKNSDLAQAKLKDMVKRLKLARATQEKLLKSGVNHKGAWWEKGKTDIFNELGWRIKFLQKNAKGRYHKNGGGFVCDNSKVAKTAYVGQNAMVLDGARVEDNAIIHEHAVVHGPKTVIKDNAKIGGKAWVFGDITVGGNARILETATVTTVGRTRAEHPEGQGEISGSAVIKGDHILRLCKEKGQVITGEVVMDYTPGTDGVVGYGDLVCGILNLKSGVFKYGRYYKRHGLGGGTDTGALYANWEFNQPKAFLLEDSYVNNNGFLYGKPDFVNENDRHYIVFNGKDQYAEAPSSVADFGELTIDMMLNRTGGKGERIFDFGTGNDECFYLEIIDRKGKPALTSEHKGKRYTVKSSEAIPAKEWVRLRVTMDGSKASIYIDGKQVANSKFKFRPRDVFSGDRPEGNFIACGRNMDGFFRGRIDHFRIYRTVHEDFDALGPVPFPLTQLQMWSEESQQLADERDGRKKEKETELLAGRYGEMLEEIKMLEKKKRDLFKTARRSELEARLKKAHEDKRALDRKMHDEFKTLPGISAAEKDSHEMRARRKEFENTFRSGAEYREALAAIAAAEEARKTERTLTEKEKSKDIARIDSGIETLRNDAAALRDDELRKARLYGQNPYPGKEAAGLKGFQQGIVYHTTVDWDYRTKEEVKGTVTPKMKEWILRVRGY
ncbi:MAG: DUF6055 domain-containing protein [Kiritimatiellia bacterium]|jgi:hypothetical protein|nr:DUF6055 domain-containing protein [Kiritimatiellia bacterium]